MQPTAFQGEYMGIFAIKVALGDAVSYADIKFVLAVSGH